MNRPTETLKGDFTAAKGDYLGQFHSDQMVLGTVRQEAGPPQRHPKALETKLAQRVPSGSCPLRSDASRDDHACRLDFMRDGQRCSRESWNTTLERQGTWSENWHGDSLKKGSTYSFSG
jgi:hypothetical protein